MPDVTSPSVAVRRCGTEQAPMPTQTLVAGPLRAVLDAGNLRYIEFAGHEALRAIAFVLRNDAWGTYVPEIEGLEVEQADAGFRVGYRATCRDAEQSLRYTARIAGSADGHLTYDVEVEPITDWRTNRSGFSVLHPVDGVAGRQDKLQWRRQSREVEAVSQSQQHREAAAPRRHRCGP